MANYRDLVSMLRDIREHVRSAGHRVLPVDEPIGMRLEYTCPTCESFWTVGLLALLESSELVRVQLAEILQDRAVRERLTAYLNWEIEGCEFLEFTGGVPALVRVSRYKRPWVV